MRSTSCVSARWRKASRRRSWLMPVESAACSSGRSRMPSAVTCGGCGSGRWGLRHRRGGGSGVVVATGGGCPAVLFFQWRIRCGGGPPVAGPVLYFFCFFSFVCHACQREAHDKDLIFAVRLQSRRTTKLVAAVLNGLPLGNFFFLSCVGYDARQRIFVVHVMLSTRQRSFTVQNFTVYPLSCVLTKNARQRVCRAFLGLFRASRTHGKPPVSRSDFCCSIGNCFVLSLCTGPRNCCLLLCTPGN
jgi:hypothetical protein